MDNKTDNNETDNNDYTYLLQECLKKNENKDDCEELCRELVKRAIDD